MIRALARFGQRLPFFVRDRGTGFAPGATPVIEAVIVNGAQVSSGIVELEGPFNTGQYTVVLDASSLRVGDRVRVLVSYAIATQPSDVVLDALITRRVGIVVSAPAPEPPVGAPSGLPAGTTTRMAFLGNSYTAEYGGMPSLLQYYLTQRLGPNSLQLGPPPVLPGSIATSPNGYFPGMSLAGMALYPEAVDQAAPGAADTAPDAIDAILAQPPGSYDYIVLTSGFRQEPQDDDSEVNDPTAFVREVLPGAGGVLPRDYGVVLETKRRIAAALTGAGISAGLIVRMTQEGHTPNREADLANAELQTRLKVIGARQLVSEGIVDAVLPDHYVWSRLQYGAFGSVGTGPTDSVPAYASLTHTNSQQAGDRNYGWLHRSQGFAAPFNDNAHQNAVATVVNAWTWAYAVWGVDPRGDDTFETPAGLNPPMSNMISDDGRIYGGQNANIGNQPYDTDVNPGGPPDAELDLDWSLATQAQIQDRIVAAVDDFYAGTTEFD